MTRRPSASSRSITSVDEPRYARLSTWSLSRHSSPDTFRSTSCEPVAMGWPMPNARSVAVASTGRPSRAAAAALIGSRAKTSRDRLQVAASERATAGGAQGTDGLRRDDRLSRRPAPRTRARGTSCSGGRARRCPRSCRRSGCPRARRTRRARPSCPRVPACARGPATWGAPRARVRPASEVHELRHRRRARSSGADPRIPGRAHERPGWERSHQPKRQECAQMSPPASSSPVAAPQYTAGHAPRRMPARPYRIAGGGRGNSWARIRSFWPHSAAAALCAALALVTLFRREPPLGDGRVGHRVVLHAGVAGCAGRHLRHRPDRRHRPGHRVGGRRRDRA